MVVDDMASTLLADKFVLAGQELGFEHVDVTAQKQFGEIFHGSLDVIVKKYSLAHACGASNYYIW